MLIVVVGVATQGGGHLFGALCAVRRRRWVSRVNRGRGVSCFIVAQGTRQQTIGKKKEIVKIDVIFLCVWGGLVVFGRFRQGFCSFCSFVLYRCITLLQLVEYNSFLCFVWAPDFCSRGRGDLMGADVAETAFMSS